MLKRRGPGGVDAGLLTSCQIDSWTIATGVETSLDVRYEADENDCREVKNGTAKQVIR